MCSWSFCVVSPFGHECNQPSQLSEPSLQDYANPVTTRWNLYSFYWRSVITPVTQSLNSKRLHYCYYRTCCFIYIHTSCCFCIKCRRCEKELSMLFVFSYSLHHVQFIYMESKPYQISKPLADLSGRLVEVFRETDCKSQMIIIYMYWPLLRKSCFSLLKV